MNRKDVLKAVRAKIGEGIDEGDIAGRLSKRLLLSHVIPDAARSVNGCAYAYATLHSGGYSRQIGRLVLDARPIGGVRALRDEKWRDNMPPDDKTFHSPENRAKEGLFAQNLCKAVRYGAMRRFCSALYSTVPHCNHAVSVGYFLSADEISRCLSLPDWCTPILSMVVGSVYVDGTGMVDLSFSLPRLRNAVNAHFHTEGERAIALAALESYQLDNHSFVKAVCERLPWFV